MLCTDANCSLSHGAIEALHSVGPLQSSPPLFPADSTLSAALSKHGKNLKKIHFIYFYIFTFKHDLTLLFILCSLFHFHTFERTSTRVAVRGADTQLRLDFTNFAHFITFSKHKSFFLNSINAQMRFPHKLYSCNQRSNQVNYQHFY